MNRISTKVYLYDSSQEANDYRGTDYSKYVLIGDSDTDNLDDTLDTAELTLAGLSFREEFEPTTKFIVEKWENSQTEDSQDRLISVFHWVVSNDTVTQPILSKDDFFNHELSLIEPTVIAQQRLVDNISVTYELKDVNLESEATYSLTDKVELNKINLNDGGHLVEYNLSNNSAFFGHRLEWVMPDWYTLSYGGTTHTPSWEDWSDFNLNQIIPYGQTQKIIYLPVPMLKCYYSHIQRDNSWIVNGFCSIDVIIQQYNKLGALVSNSTTTVNPSSTNINENYWNRDDFGNPISSSFLANGDIVSHFEFFNYKGQSDLYYQLGKKYFITKMRELENNAELNSNRLISLTIENGYNYKIILKKHVYNNLSATYSSVLNTTQFRLEKYMVGESKSNWTLPFINTILRKGFMNISNSTSFISNDNFPIINIQFNAVDEVAPNLIMFKSAPPSNAYDLFIKSQLTTQNFKKTAKLPIKNTITQFYLNNDDVQQLQNTTIIENFYNQKNLHEIFMDIGKYIHARPKAKFGSDDRFLIDWKKYGQTTQYEDVSRPISIFNSRFVEEYISSVSSYVTNMVQLGGIITEIIAPKSSSEDYLVYNDVAEIKTSKNIIQIDNLEVIRVADNEIRNLTGNGTLNESENGYVFEKNVYKLLSLDAYDNINKGLAIYYELGTNVIKGLNFQLPSRTVGSQTIVYDYTIKRIIGTVYELQESDWANIKVNDYLFRITYKTKDTLRTDQTRPDLRKYLLNSKYDNIPIHYQFNNQQDLVVDSNKFGHNMYGKLIRTGNTTYERVEYVVDLEQLKHSGELYNIYGNLYYVSKVINTYYPNYIISQVEFSKDFNRLSEIIGIPSEPRFYEISEQSLINREIVFNDYIEVLHSSLDSPPDNENIANQEDRYTTTKYFDENLKHYLSNWEYINKLVFNKGNFSTNDYPKYAITFFKSDEDSYNPSNNVGEPAHLVETCSPVSTYSVNNTLTIEWDMEDNFSAGDQVLINHNPSGTDTNKAYNTLQPFRYPDVYGRCDMVDFYITPNIAQLDPSSNIFNPLFVRQLPSTTIIPTNETENIFSSEQIIPTNGEKIRFVESLQNASSLTDYFSNRNYGDFFSIGTIPAGASSNYWVWDKENLHECTFQGNLNTLYELYSIQNPNYKDCYFVNVPYNYYVYDNVGSNNSPNYQWVPLFSFLDGRFDKHSQGVIILKDNREALSFNMNVNVVANSDRFVFSSYFWQPNKQDVYIGLLNTEVNKITNNVITNADFLVEHIPFNADTFTEQRRYLSTLPHNPVYTTISKTCCIKVDIQDALEDYKTAQGLTDEEFNKLLDDTKSIVIYSDRYINNNSNAGAKYFILARNVSDLSNTDKLGYWYLRPLFKDNLKTQ